MPPAGEGGSTPGNVGDRGVPRKPPRRRIPRRTIERIHPGNLEFERQVAAVEARQEQQRQNQMSDVMGSLSFRVYWPYLSILSDDHMEDFDSEITWNDIFALPGQSAPLLHQDGTPWGKEQLLKDSPKPDDNDFLEDAFLKINSDKMKNTRNKKNKNKKKKKGKGKGKKQSSASEMQSKPPTEPSSTCADATGSEALASSSRHVATDVPLLEYSSSSSSSRVTEVITVVVSGASSGNEKDQPSSSTDDFKSFDSTASYATAASSAVNYNTGGKAWNITMDDQDGCLSDARIEVSLPVSETTDSRGFEMSAEGNKPNDDQISCSSAITPAGRSQEDSPCGTYASNDSDFQKVISRKAARKMKKVQRMESITPSPTMAASVPNMTSALVPRAPHREVLTIGHYIKGDCFHGRKPNHGKGKYQKGSSSSKISKTGYNGGENVPDSSRMLVTTTVHQGKPASTRTPSSTSHHQATLEPIDETSPPEHLPVKGKQKAKALVDDTKDTDSRALSSDRTSPVGHLAISSCVDNKEQKKEQNRQAFSTHAPSELDKIVKAANDAYKIQAASDVYMDCGIHADIETFLHSATPVIRQISCRTSNISLQDQCLWSVWSWYEKPECFGIDVKRQGRISSSWPQLSTYFLPSLSAVQLFGHSGKSGNKFGTPEEPCLLSPDHGELCFEYFETENPFSRPPLFTKIKQLLDGGNLSCNPIFGDPKQLKSVKLSDLHPASWFCVAWYPIYQIPEAAGKCKAAFLTYHCPVELIKQTSPTDMADGHDHVICPIVGLMGYKDQEWHQLGEEAWSKSRQKKSSETNPVELINQRLATLRCSASIMSKAVVPRPSGKDMMNYHSDYLFFCSRSKY